MSKNKRTTWLYMDNLIAYYFYRKLETDTKKNRAYIKPFLLNSCKMNSVFKKFRNYKSLDKRGGLENTGEKIKPIYNEFKDKSLEDIKQAIIKRKKEKSNFFNVDFLISEVFKNDR